jgi:HEAT repeat protein
MTPESPETQCENRVVRKRDLVAAYDQGDIQTLIAGLSDDNLEIRRSAPYWLGKLGGDEAVTALRPTLDDPNPGVRRDAVYALARIGDASAVEALIEAARHEDVETRAIAALNLGKLRAVEAVPALLECLEVEDYTLQKFALQALGKIGDRVAIPKVAEVQETTPLLGVALQATDTLAQLGGPRGVSQFVSLLTDTDRHFEEHRPGTHSPPDTPLKKWQEKPARVKWWMKKYSADRLVELRAAEAAPAVEQAAATARSIRERLLLRRTARRLRQT